MLDRLNSLLEPGGDLLISERGLDPDGNLTRLKPHPEFRLILTVDENTSGGMTLSGCNNISRAMRNRGVELVLTRDVSWFDRYPGKERTRSFLSLPFSSPWQQKTSVVSC